MDHYFWSIWTNFFFKDFKIQAHFNIDQIDFRNRGPDQGLTLKQWVVRQNRLLKGKHVLKPYFLRLGNLEFFCTELTSWICISVNECNFSHFHHTVAIFRWNFNQTSSNKRSEQASSIQSMLQNSNGCPKRGSTFLLLIFDVIKYIESVQESR